MTGSIPARDAGPCKPPGSPFHRPLKQVWRQSAWFFDHGRCANVAKQRRNCGRKARRNRGKPTPEKVAEGVYQTPNSLSGALRGRVLIARNQAKPMRYARFRRFDTPRGRSVFGAVGQSAHSNQQFRDRLLGRHELGGDHQALTACQREASGPSVRFIPSSLLLAVNECTTISITRGQTPFPRILI